MRLLKWILWSLPIIVLMGCSGTSSTTQVSDGVVIEKGKPTLLFFYTDN
ncbi:MAG: hypothetical protein SH821_14545 [Phototrophicales bacterium]|nr:hypothetical protein [Phototrophicales bacterium]